MKISTSVNMGLYKKILVEKSATCYQYSYSPTYEPNLATPATAQLKQRGVTSPGRVMPQLTEERKNSVKNLSEEEKQTLLKQLHYGQGDLNAEDWGEFLLNAEAMGLITNDERALAGGYTYIAGETDQWGQVKLKYEDSFNELLDKWNGDPIHFMDEMNLFLLKANANSELDGYFKVKDELSEHFSACSKVKQIIFHLYAQQ